MMNFLKRLDQFGIAYQQQIHKREKQFKTAFGGLVSLLLYTLSLAYFLYKIALWINGDILPRVSVSKSTQSYADITFDYDPIMFQVVGMSGDKFIDPFSKTENIITPFFAYVDDIIISEKQSMLDSSVSPSRTGISTTVFPENVTLVLNQQGITDESPKPQRQLMILFERCNNSKYDNCASIEKQEQFFLQPLSTYFITINMQQFNTRSQEFDMISKQIYFVLDGDTVLYTQVLFQITTSITDTGFILEKTKQQKFISNFQTTSQQLPQKNFEQSFGAKYLAVFLLGVDTLSETQLILYPKIGEILADVGSIMSTLMLLRIIVIAINTQILEENLIQTVINFYYPEMKQIKFNKNFLGKIISAEKNGQVLEESEHFIKFYEKLKEDTLEKLTIINMLYEISRLQFIVQSLQNKSVIKQCHCIGIKILCSNLINQSFLLDIKEGSANPPKIFVKSAEKSRDEKNESFPLQLKAQQETLEPPRICETLTDEDFMILSHLHHMKKAEDIDKHLPQFYNLNSVAY